MKDTKRPAAEWFSGYDKSRPAVRAEGRRIHVREDTPGAATMVFVQDRGDVRLVEVQCGCGSTILCPLHKAGPVHCDRCGAIHKPDGESGDA